MEMIVNLIHIPKEKIPKGDDVAQGTQENKDNVHVE